MEVTGLVSSTINKNHRFKSPNHQSKPPTKGYRKVLNCRDWEKAGYQVASLPVKNNLHSFAGGRSWATWQVHPALLKVFEKARGEPELRGIAYWHLVQNENHPWQRRGPLATVTLLMRVIMFQPSNYMVTAKTCFLQKDPMSLPERLDIICKQGKGEILAPC